LDEQSVSAHLNLGISLVEQRRPAEALPSYYKVIELRPKYADAHNNLGIALRALGRLDDAIAAYRRAIELQPDFAKAYCNLGHVLRQKGRFEEALAALKRGHELGSREKAWRHPSAQWVKQCERFLELEGRMAQVLHGELKLAKADEQIEFAQLFHMKAHYAASAKFWADAFTAEPKLADNLQAGHRYNAACAAALAAADPLVERRMQWRTQALDWLRADVKAFADLLARDAKASAAIAKTMRFSQTDPELASIREDARISRLSNDEQASWREFWDEVEAVRQDAERASAKSSP
jgi:Tfp pilus assembly protein PilF